MATTQQKKFIDLLEEIFQFDQADLDFGIYRIMNQKREEVTNFLNNELVPQVKKAFDKYKNADVEAIKQQMEELEQKLNEMGVAKDSSEKYLTLNERLNKGVDITALENEVFSDLTNFFRRYYYEGDFLSLRRYKKDVYAIPYEGEEVKLHWANADQYYVKTSEYFRDYTFKLPSGKTVHFKLVEANTEQNNNKAQEGKERRFILFEEEPVKEENGELYIHFEYKPPEGKRTQKQLNESTLEYLYSLKGYKDWLQELETLTPTEKNKKRTLLEKYLNDYTARNTFDYFIHKDLGGFLRRELDFFIKNEVMHLDDLDTENEKGVEQYLSKVKVIKSIGQKIIAFLEQIENFQKKLWLKKKFVVETNYCFTLDHVNEEFYKEILSNEKQIDEWKELYDIEAITGYSEPLTLDFLIQNPYLMIDTAYFSSVFKDKLVASIENLDGNLDGLLIHSENFQALNLIQEKYKAKTNHIYIDPPYNAKSSEILYKNNYKHSSWASFIKNRIEVSKPLLEETATITVAIDENENINLGYILNDLFNKENYKNTCVTVIHNPGGIQGKNFSYTHEYAYFVHPKNGVYIGTVQRDDVEATPLRDWGGEESKRETAANCFYPIYTRNGEVIKFGDVCKNDFHPDKAVEKLENDIMVVYPIDSNGVERKWRFARDTVETIKDELKCELINNEWTIRRYKTDYRFKTVWTDKKYNANTQGSNLLGRVLGGKYFDFPKSLYTVQDSLLAVLPQREVPLVLDYFAGSGTTGHAIVDMQRKNIGKRKYILIEMGNHFDTVVMKRMKKVIYSAEWKKGKPVDRDGVSHSFKYIRLESYEDTLNNVRLQRSPLQQSAMDEDMSSAAREEYLLSYMLDVESEGSLSLLNTDSFSNPFDYNMMITQGTESKLTRVDLIETFNYLTGLHVRTIDMIKGIKVVTGKLRTGEEVLILWRNIDEVSNEQLEDFFKKQGYNTRDNEFDRIYVNGDNHLENLKLAEDKWKVVLIEDEFKRLMFDVYDV